MFHNELNYGDIKGKTNPKIYSCIDWTQYLLVDLCKKITNLQFSECSVIFKNKLVADVVNYLRNQYPEGLIYMNNFLKILAKLPEIFQKYYNAETESIIENINILNNQKLFRINTEKTESNSTKTLTSSMSDEKNIIFLEFIIKHIECVRDILELMKANMDLFVRMNQIYITINDSLESNSNPSTMSFGEDLFKDLIEDYEKLSEFAKNFEKDYLDSEYIQNTFSPLLIQISEDIETMKALLKSYKSILCLDPVNTISNLIISRKNIENLKSKYQNIFDLKIYVFFVQYHIDNIHKTNIFFQTYFDNKKFNLLQNFSEQKLKNAFESDLEIKNEVFSFRSNFYVDKYMKRLFEDGVDFSYFLIVFEKKKFNEVEILNSRENLIKSFYFNSGGIFIETDDDYAILTFFHTVESNYKNILNEISTHYKNVFSNTSENKTNIQTQINLPNNNKTKVNNIKDTLILYRISKYTFIAVKLKEKTQNDVNIVNESCRSFRMKFANLHLFKTIFPINHLNLSK
jgi:hypothetical protein